MRKLGGFLLFLSRKERSGMKNIHLILTRHGETLENRQHLMQGHIPGTLSPLGIQQAEELAVALQGKPIDVIVCSDLARSYDTAMAVARVRGMDVVPTPLLREIDWGPHTGGRLDRLDWDCLPEGCETLEQLFQRAGRFLNFLGDHYSGKQVLAIGHGAIDRAIIARLSGKTAGDMVDMPIMKNTECVEFNF